MTRTFKTLALAGLAVAAAGLFAFVGAGAARATAPGEAPPANASTPGDWNWEIKDGKRVPKASNRIVKPDGSWSETTKQGSCTTVKEMTPAGEYKESRSCN